MGMLPTFFRKSRERPDQQPPVYVCCTFLIVFDGLMIIDSILDSNVFSRKLQNFMGYRLERSFTAVKYLESYFRNTMTEFRLNGLAGTFAGKIGARLGNRVRKVHLWRLLQNCIC
ncbi:hypothetical protein T12_8922 [Trichinella patagoniensis]|uniref:Uncharacterized protein n=1 Tax=Trichinella patagoniensis TaxID=990121 RepID=A0A0V0ZBG1_9BILA|nr:hypothetical protein T12_8922 [Trichinella patagoniensis]